MSHFTSTSLSIFSLFLHLLLLAQCHIPPVPSINLVDGFFEKTPPFEKTGPLRDAIPALYVFGDSLVDNGNNNYLGTTIRANYLPFGVDFNNTPTGRFTNGRTIVDFIAQLTGLPFPPPYMGLSNYEKKGVSTGVNYASASCGILHNTGKNLGACLSFNEQINLFKTTIEDGLNSQFNSSEELAQHLSKSLFFINFGLEDFVINYAANVELRKQFSPSAFGQHLSEELAKRLQRLYKLGARKFLVTNVGPIGCLPIILEEMVPSTQCFDPLNAFVSPYNSQLPTLLTKLQSTLPQSTFVHVDIYKLTAEVLVKPKEFGIKNTWSGCSSGEELCEDRNQYLFFDLTHPSQAFHFLLAKRCFEDSSICNPLNLNQLLCPSF